MGPAGTPFMWLTLALVTVAVVATLLLWPRLAKRRSVPHVAGRIGLILTSQALAAVAALVVVNKTMGPFYVTWSDLFGQDVGAVAGGSVPETSNNLTAQQGKGAQAAKDGLTWRHYQGRFERTRFKGPKSGLTGEVDVYTPPQYDDPANAKREFPVVMLLHGVPGTNSGWVGDGAMAVEKQVDPLFAAGTVQPFVLVVADVGNNSTNTECSDLPDRGNRATWLAVDVRTMITQSFHVSPDPKRWAALGYSTGGFCAVKLAVQYPQAFHYGMSIAGDDYHGDPAVFGSDEKAREENSPLWILANAKPTPDVSLYVMTSKQDEVGLTRYSDDLSTVAAKAGVPLAAFTVEHGGHLTATWRQLEAPAFEWLNTQMGSGG